MAAGFPGFPKEMTTFFRNLKRNNRREWFQPRKHVFERHVKEPMIELVTALSRDFAKFAPEYVGDPKKAIFRIYRDTRFSADKTPYKTHIAASFARRGGERLAAGGFYFSVSHDQIEVAGGIYHPEPETMLVVRNHIAEHHQDLRRLLADLRDKQALAAKIDCQMVDTPPNIGKRNSRFQNQRQNRLCRLGWGKEENGCEPREDDWGFIAEQD